LTKGICKQSILVPALQNFDCSGNQSESILGEGWSGVPWLSSTPFPVGHAMETKTNLQEG